MSNLNIIRAALCAGAMAVALPSTAAAQRPVVVGGGLVNAQIVDVIDDISVNVEDINVTVGAAVQVAANVCGVAVGVIAADLQDGVARATTWVDGTGCDGQPLGGGEHSRGAPHTVFTHLQCSR